jgi:hypothetical protein
MHPQYLAFLAGLLKMSLSLTNRITGEDEFAVWSDK